MVRKSLAETLNAQAKEFLEEGRPKKASQPIPEPQSSSPLSGIDRVLETNWWSKDDQSAIKAALLERYCDQLTKAGFRVTSNGLVDSTARGAPSTRGVEKELRVLRREVAILADVVRSLLDLSVQLGGRTPEDLRLLLCGTKEAKVAAKDEPKEESPDTEGVAAKKQAVRGEEAETSPAAKPPGAATQDAPKENGNARPEAPAPEAVSDAEDEDSFFDSFLRPAANKPGAGNAARTSAKPAAPRLRPLKDRGEEAPAAKEKPRERVPRRELWKERVPERTKTCPRCSREVSIRVPRCLSCGKTF